MSDREWPAVTVIVPSFNHEEFIRETIKSCIKQDYPGLIDIVVVDDCSTDNSFAVATEIAKTSVADRRVSVFLKEQRTGINQSIEFGLRHSVGEFVQLLASDDVIAKGKIREQVDLLIKDDLDCVYGDAIILGSTGRERVTYPDFVDEQTRKLRVCTQDTQLPLAQSGLFRRSFLETIGPLRSEIESDDWAMLIYAVLHSRVGYLPKPMVFYRLHAGNSYKKAWPTLGMRVSVVGKVVPQDLRIRALSNVLSSHGELLWRTGQRSQGLRIYISALTLSPITSAFATYRRLRGRVRLRA